MYVFAVLECGDEGFVAGEVRHDAQLNLGIVGGNDDAALRCGEGAAHAAAFGGADGDVLQVGVVAGEAAGNGDGLGVGGMYAAVFGGNHFGQFVGVGGFKFCQAAVLQNDFGQRVVGRELFEHGFVGGNAAFGSFFQAFGGDAHFVEQDFLQLFGRVEVERLACGGVGFLFELHQLGAEFRALAGEFGAVDLHAVAFHFKQYLRDGQLHFFIHFKLFVIHLRAQVRFEAQGEIGVLGGVFGRLPDGDIGKTDLLRTFAAQRFVGNGFQAQPAFG